MGWYAFYQVEPWGEERAWERACMIAMTVFNKLRVKGESARDLRSFMPQWFRSSKGGRQTQQEQLALMKSIFSGLPHKEHDPREAQE